MVVWIQIRREKNRGQEEIKEGWSASRSHCALPFLPLSLSSSRAFPHFSPPGHNPTPSRNDDGERARSAGFRCCGPVPRSAQRVDCGGSDFVLFNVNICFLVASLVVLVLAAPLPFLRPSLVIVVCLAPLCESAHDWRSVRVPSRFRWYGRNDAMCASDYIPSISLAAFPLQCNEPTTLKSIHPLSGLFSRFSFCCPLSFCACFWQPVTTTRRRRRSPRRRRRRRRKRRKISPRRLESSARVCLFV